MGISLIGLVDSLVRFYSFLILVYVILSWFPASGGISDLRRFLATICEPYIGIFRRIVPVMGVGGAGIDFSPLVALLALQFGYQLVRPALLALL